MTKEQLAKELYPMEQGEIQMNSYQSEKRSAFIAGCDAAEPKWISVEDKLPETLTPVYVYTSNGMQLIGRRYLNRWTAYFADGEHPCTITHWMSLPKTPSND